MQAEDGGPNFEVCGDGIKDTLEMTGVKFQSEDDYPRPDQTESEAYIY